MITPGGIAAAVGWGQMLRQWNNLARVWFAAVNSPDWFRAPIFRAWCAGAVLCCIAAPWPRADAAGLAEVVSRKDRCASRMQDLEQQVDRLLRSIDRLDRLTRDAPPQSGSLAESARNKAGYFRERLDRSRTQFAGIEDRLANVQGACPDCLAADVDLFCRQVEGARDEIAEYLDRVREEERGLATGARVSALLARAESGLAALARDSSRLSAASREILVKARAAQGKAAAALREGRIEEASDLALTLSEILAGARAGTFAERVEAAGREIDIVKKRLAVAPDSRAAVLVAKSAEHLAAARDLENHRRPGDARAELEIAETLLSKIPTPASK